MKNEEEVLRMVISRAWEDEIFRKNLVADPINTIENFTGVKIVIPEGKELIVNDQTDKSKVYVNIPGEPEMDDIELTEDQLMKIAGGKQSFEQELVNMVFPTLKNYIKL